MIKNLSISIKLTLGCESSVADKSESECGHKDARANLTFQDEKIRWKRYEKDENSIWQKVSVCFKRMWGIYDQ